MRPSDFSDQNVKVFVPLKLRLPVKSDAYVLHGPEEVVLLPKASAKVGSCMICPAMALAWTAKPLL